MSKTKDLDWGLVNEAGSVAESEEEEKVLLEALEEGQKYSFSMFNGNNIPDHGYICRNTDGTWWWFDRMPRWSFYGEEFVENDCTVQPEQIYLKDYKPVMFEIE
jgi:hypothetical protein